MKSRKMLLPALLSIALIFSLIVPASIAGASATMHWPDDYSISHSVVDSSSASFPMVLNTPEGEVTPMVATGYFHTVGLKSDGTVVAVGRNAEGQCNVGGWTDITYVATGAGHTLGLKADGTVVAVGYNGHGQCDVGGWTGITQVAAGYAHTVGLKADGTVVAVGYNSRGQCDVGGWTDITYVAAGSSHTVGLKDGGTVAAVGDNSYGQCDVGDWTDITLVAAGGYHTVGLKADGTVVAVGTNYYGQCDVEGWTGITLVAAGGEDYGYTVGLKSDGTVVAVGANYSGQCDVSGWTDITYVAAGSSHTVGLKSDGTLIAVGGANDDGQCNVGGWTDINYVAAGSDYTVGVKSDGTVVAVGANYSGQCDVGNWTDIVQVTAGLQHTVGRKSDGTLVAVGANYYGQCDVGDWTDIVQVAAAGAHTVGLKSDGTLVAVGYNSSGQCDVSGWTDIIQVDAGGGGNTVGLKPDGTVVAVGSNLYGCIDIGSWTDITQVDAGGEHTVGVKSDGTVVALGRNYEGQCDVGGWTDIVNVTAGGREGLGFGHTVGLKSDGTVVAVGDNSYGQCDVGGWTDITQVDAGFYHTVGLKSDGTVVAAGPGTEFDTWNLVLALPPSQRVLTISSNAGGSVTTPGEGTFSYDEGTAVNLVADAEENYEFVEWTGDVDTIADVNAAQTTITMDNSYSIVANFELEEGLCSLTISSSAGGSVSTPGEGTFIYDEGTVVDLVAEPEEGYLFVNWTGDVDTIGNVTAAAANITMDDIYSITANFMSVEAGDVGIKAGDWIKIDYKITGWPAGQPYPEWLKLEFLSVEGTSANVRVMMHISDGTEQIDTVPVDLGEGGGEAFGLAGFVISANLTTGDSVYMTGCGNVTIEGETTRTYAGARRTVVYASTSQDEVQLTYYWDKQTGVMVEASTTYPGMTATAKATETNMWEATAVGMLWWPWIIVAVVAVGLVIFFVRRRGRVPADTSG